MEQKKSLRGFLFLQLQDAFFLIYESLSPFFEKRPGPARTAANPLVISVSLRG